MYMYTERWRPGCTCDAGVVRGRFGPLPSDGGSFTREPQRVGDAGDVLPVRLGETRFALFIVETIWSDVDLLRDFILSRFRPPVERGGPVPGHCLPAVLSV